MRAGQKHSTETRRKQAEAARAKWVDRQQVDADRAKRSADDYLRRLIESVSPSDKAGI